MSAAAVTAAQEVLGGRLPLVVECGQRLVSMEPCREYLSRIALVKRKRCCGKYCPAHLSVVVDRITECCRAIRYKLLVRSASPDAIQDSPATSQQSPERLT